MDGDVFLVHITAGASAAESMLPEDGFGTAEGLSTTRKSSGGHAIVLRLR